MRSSFVAILSVLSVESSLGFTPPVTPGRVFLSSTSRNSHTPNNEMFGPINFGDNSKITLESVVSSTKASALSFAAVAMATPAVANAAGPDWGIFEGRTGSLLHPVMMGSMLLLSLSTGLLGFQYRRQRTIGSEISSLKKQLPTFEGSSLKAAITALESMEEVDAAHVAKLKTGLPLQDEIDALQKERKELSSLNARDKHFGQGATLAFLGTAFAIEGPLNTYARAGKLFPGPHLYAGAGLVVLWALAGAMVPAMTKGNDTARAVHIGANVGGIGLFTWQVVSGWPILLKVIEKTSWP